MVAFLLSGLFCLLGCLLFLLLLHPSQQGRRLKPQVGLRHPLTAALVHSPAFRVFVPLVVEPMLARINSIASLCLMQIELLDLPFLE